MAQFKRPTWHVIDDKMLSKTRRKMNKKKSKHRVYGLDAVPVNEMHNGNIPGAMTANILGHVQASKWSTSLDDIKRQNRMKSPTLHTIYQAFDLDDTVNQLPRVGPYDYDAYELVVDDNDRFNSSHDQYDSDSMFNHIPSGGPVVNWWREDQSTPRRPIKGEENAEVVVGGRMRGPTIKKIDLIRGAFPGLVRQGLTRQQIIDTLVSRYGVTDSTATSYYERLAKESGLTQSNSQKLTNFVAPRTSKRPTTQGNATRQRDNSYQNWNLTRSAQDDSSDESQDIDDTTPGIIRQVDNAHLVFKRRTPTGTFEELWIYNIGSDLHDELTIRRAILAGTDIPINRTQSPDGLQHYSLSTMGNAQLLHIVGLPN